MGATDHARIDGVPPLWRGVRTRSTLLLIALALAVLFAVSCSTLGTRVTVISALVVTVVFLIAQRPAYGVAVVIALAPLEAVGRVSPDLPWLTYTRLALAGTVLAILAFQDLGDSMSRIPKGFGLLALYVLAGIIGSTLNVATSTSMIEIAAALLGLLLVWIVAVAVRSREDLLVLWRAVIVGATAVVFVALLDLLTGTSALGTVERQFSGSSRAWAFPNHGNVLRPQRFRSLPRLRVPRDPWCLLGHVPLAQMAATASHGRSAVLPVHNVLTRRSAVLDGSGHRPCTVVQPRNHEAGAGGYVHGVRRSRDYPRDPLRCMDRLPAAPY